MSDPVRAHVALGANIDAPRQRVRQAVQALGALPSTRVVACSSLYRTPPWGITEQPDFINAAAAIDTMLDAHALLRALQALETAAGRRRDGPRNGPRCLDLDLLLYGGECLNEADLVVPHPRMHQRAFVLLPLAEIAAAVSVPGRGRVADLLARVDAGGCLRLDATPADDASTVRAE